MEKVNEKKIVFPLNGLRVCVDQFSTYDLSGRVYSRLAGEMKFSTFSEFLLKADRLMDEKKFPQSFQKKRTFDENMETMSGKFGNEMSDQEIIEQKGKYRTFDLVIQSRKKTTWQGFIRLESGEFAGEFESVLELTAKIFAGLENAEEVERRTSNPHFKSVEH